MEDVAWILSLFVIAGVGYLFGYWSMRQSALQDMRQIQNDVYDIIFDTGEPHTNRKPLVLRLKTLDKYFNLDEIREERPTDESLDDVFDISTNDISDRIVNADGVQGIRRGLNV